MIDLQIQLTTRIISQQTNNTIYTSIITILHNIIDHWRDKATQDSTQLHNKDERLSKITKKVY